MGKIIDHLRFILINYWAFTCSDKVILADSVPEKSGFEVIYQWQYLNYTWPNIIVYKTAIKKLRYIPKNNAPTGFKIYGGKIFLSIPKYRPGIPVTLAYVPMVDEGITSNELLRPYPNWEMNINEDCDALRSVQSMEIDQKGHMWVIDGERKNQETKCPAKLLILDLKKRGKVIHKYTFPNEIALTEGALLNDIVLDDVGGGFAYITDSSSIDPGLVVYSRKENRSWKLRDPSMFAELPAADFVVNGTIFRKLVTVDGIALSPAQPDGEKQVFFCPLTAYTLYSINTSILKNESLTRGDQWHRYVVSIGKKQAQSDGLIVDNTGNLYYTLLPLSGIGKWNIKTPITTSEVIYENQETMIWPDTFAMDNNGFLYLISNRIYEFNIVTTKLTITSEFKFKIFRHFTGTKNYMY